MITETQDLYKRMYYIGIDLGGTIIKIGFVCNGNVIDVVRLDAYSQAGLEKSLEPMSDAINMLLSRNSASMSEFGGIALAFPGIVDRKSGRAIATNAKYNDAPQVDMRSWAMSNWGVGLVMDNDARMAAVGEWLFGAGQGCDNVVMMTIGTGVGTGTIVDGRLIYGANSCAGALGGHMIVDYRGRECTCGNVGCVESHGSSFFLPRIIAENPLLSQAFKLDIGNCNFKTLFEKYREGNKDAVSVAEECMDVWSAGVVNYIHAYDPQLVIMGGGIMKSADIILPYVRAKVEALAWQPAGKAEIVASQLGDNAAIMASEYYFKK